MKHITIIGAGSAGLTAAYELLKKNSDIQVNVLEKSNRIGVCPVRLSITEIIWIQVATGFIPRVIV